jgi:hypothetical protein
MILLQLLLPHQSRTHMTLAIRPALSVLTACCGIVTTLTTAELEQYGFYPHQLSFSHKTEQTDCGFLQRAPINFYSLQENICFIFVLK